MSVIETTVEAAPISRPKLQTLREYTFDGVISSLWRMGLDTNQIAAAARLKECDVANRIAFLRDSGRL